jgi:hypothetical protein
VRVKGVVLEYDRDIAVLRRDAVHHAAADPDLALGRVLEPGDDPQRRGLAAARGPDQDEQLPVHHLEVHPADRVAVLFLEALAHAAQHELGHRAPSP